MKSSMKHREMLLLWEVGKTGSVTHAAERVHISQPAASALLRQLEERLGFALFDRSKRRLEFTAKGRALLAEVANALAALDAVSRLALTMRTESTPRIAVGSVASIAATVLPAAVRRLTEAMPGAVLTVRTAVSLEIASLVAEQRVDFGVVVGEGMQDGPGCRLVAPLPLMCIVPGDHPLATLAAVSIDQLVAQPYVVLGRQFAVGSVTAQVIESAGHRYSPVVEVMQFSAACAFVEAGWGVAVLESVSAIYAAKQGLVAVRLDADTSLSVALLWAVNSSLGGYAPLFAEGLVSALASAIGAADTRL